VAITKLQLKQLIREELQNVLLEDMNDPSCIKEITRVKNDGYYPLKHAAFYDAKGNPLRIFQRNSSTLKPGWYYNETTADDKELLQLAMDALKKKLPRGASIKVKSDPNITSIAVRALSKKDFRKAFWSCDQP